MLRISFKALGSFASFALTFIPCSFALAQTAPRAFFEQSTPSGAGNLLTVSRVPVVTSTGAILYRDIQIQFDVSAAGALTLKPGFPIVAASPVLLTGNFIAGKYKLGTNYLILSGPGAGPNGRSSWSLNDQTGNGSCLRSAGWTSGAVAGHPLQTRLTNARITYPGYSYGVLGNLWCSGGGVPYYWHDADLIGVAATARGFTIYRYTNNGGVDQSSPVDSASFQLCPATGAC